MKNTKRANMKISKQFNEKIESKKHDLSKEKKKKNALNMSEYEKKSTNYKNKRMN